MSRVSWSGVALWTGLFFLGVLLWGVATGFLEWRVTSLSPWAFARASLVLLVFPGLAEELVFRVWLLPHPREAVPKRRLLPWLGGSVAIFVLWHIVNAWLFFHVARPLFWDWRFLVITAWLGWVCGGVYLRSGTIWAPALIHWLTVVIWKACFAGPVFFE